MPTILTSPLIAQQTGLAGLDEKNPALSVDAQSASPASKSIGKQGVILLHGLCRTSASMKKMQKALSAEGYTVHAPDYPSRKHDIDTLSRTIIPASFQHPSLAHCQTINIVTHSLGGILVRNYFRNHPEANNPHRLRLGRVVMLGPPNQGSEVTDCIKHWPLYRLLNGPAGLELGTNADSQPKRLGPVDFETGIIAGHLTINWINSFLMIPGPDDGKVSLESAKLEGMKDYLVLPTSHPFIMKNRRVIDEVKHFLNTGFFTRS